MEQLSGKSDAMGRLDYFLDLDKNEIMVVSMCGDEWWGHRFIDLNDFDSYRVFSDADGKRFIELEELPHDTSKFQLTDD